MIHLSPKATAVALVVRPPRGLNVVASKDSDLVYWTGLKKDTVYRALVELQDLGALTFTATTRTDPIRTLTINHDSWVWAAVASLEAAADAELVSA